MPWMGVQCHFCLGLDLNLAERGQPDWLLDERVQLAGRQAAAASEGGTLELAARLFTQGVDLAEKGQPRWLLAKAGTDERVQLASRQAAAASEGEALELAARLLPKV